MRLLALLLLLFATRAIADPLEPCQRLYDEVVFDGAVDYARVAAHPDRTACARALATAPPPTVPAAAVAFWADAYNLLNILAIAEEPTRWSARQDGKTLFHDRVFSVAGQQLTLDQIERDKLGAHVRDPRIEFLLSCGSRSCALLPSRLLSAARARGQGQRAVGDDPAATALEAAMADGVRRWFARPENLRVRREAGVIELGQLLQLDWHGADFVHPGTPPETQLAALVASALESRDPEAARDLRSGRLRLVIRPYDWRVNRLRRVFILP